MNIYFNSFLYLLLICFLSPNISFGQCGVANDYEPQSFSSASINSKSSNNTIDIKVNVFAIREDDGTGGISKAQAEMLFQGVASTFEDYGIILNYCVREVWDSNRLNTQSSGERYYILDCDRLNISLYNSPLGFIAGQAVVTGIEGWAFVSESTVVHEIGHMLSLLHTFNGDECPDQYCSNNQSTNLVDYQIPNGDGLCDTPADDCGSGPCAFIASNCISTNNPNHPGVASCGEDYADPDNVIAKNFMTYTRSCNQYEFTNGQQLQMHNAINQYLPEIIGTISSCSQEPLYDWSVNGLISDEPDFVVSNQTIHLGNNLHIQNSRVTFVDCILKFRENTFLLLDDSQLYLDGSTLETDNSTCAAGIEWQGITAMNQSFLNLSNGTSITAEYPINVLDFNNNGQTRLLCTGDDFTINSTDRTALFSNSTATFMLRNGVINGQISFVTNNQIFPHYFPANGLSCYECEINPAGSGDDLIGINLGTGSLGLNNSKLKGFSIPFRGGNIWTIHLDKTFVNGGNSPTLGIDIRSALFATFNNNHLEDVKLGLRDIGFYKITSNKLNNCIGNCFSGHVSISGEETHHLFENNRLISTSRGVNSTSDVETKFLCNKFDKASTYNFNWQGVNTFQGTLDIGTGDTYSAGNIFSEDAQAEVSGNSISVSYYYDENKLDEILDKNTNGGVNPFPLDLASQCGLIGPDWPSPSECPPGIVCNEDCPTGINCNAPCPAGIDCTEDCPRGIDCTEDCPPGIVCSVPCPPGIVCSVPCPPGIDCTIPCPPGIDCTTACPPGIDCTTACPPGIVCINPCKYPDDCVGGCPLGIICTEPCPPGIDCTIPCPPGIDCTAACPPGIICTEPCPPGIVCTEPCPDGIDCSVPCLNPILCAPAPCDEDPVLTYVEWQYQELTNEYDLLYQTLHQDNVFLNTILEHQTLNNKPKILLELQENEAKVSPVELKAIFENSKIYTEKEMVDILLSNPVNLYYKNINNVVFRSGSFSDVNLIKLKTAFNAIQDSEEVLTLFELDNLTIDQLKLVRYAIFRLDPCEESGVYEQNNWLERMGTLQATLASLDNSFKLQNFNQINNSINKALNNGVFDVKDQNDLLAYKDLLWTLKSAAQNGMTYNTLDDSHLLAVEGYAYGQHHHTSSKAKSILTEFYGYEFAEEIDTRSLPDKLEFLQQESGLDYWMENINVFPNPTLGNIQIENPTGLDLKLRLMNTAGQQVFISSIPRLKTSKLELNMASGIYHYSLEDMEGNVVRVDKLVIIQK